MTVPFTAPRHEVLDLRAPYGLPGASEIDLATAPAVSAFGRYAPCKPGYSLRRARPAAADNLEPYPVSVIEAPHRAPQRGDDDYWQFHLQQSPGQLHGRARDPRFYARKVMFRAIEAKTDKVPHYLVVSPTKTGDVEFGAAWKVQRGGPGIPLGQARRTT